MSIKKIKENAKKGNSYPNNLDQFDHFIAVDWALKNMSVARLTNKKLNPIIIDVPSNIKDLKDYLKSLKGRKILTIEETTTSQWLFVELYDIVEKIVICDPFRNKLLSEGAKTDKLDAGKLCLLLKNGMLKEVYHTTDSIYELRTLVSSYNDVVSSGVRLLNRKSALYRAENKSHKKDLLTPKSKVKKFVLAQINEDIEKYYQTKADYEKEFEKLVNKNKTLRNLGSIPGIGKISSVTILASVIDAKRFIKPNNYLSYCGLVKHEKLSGGRSYGKRTPRYSRKLKSIYKSAALRSICYENPIKEYYVYLLSEKKLTEQQARNSVARYIAKVSLAIIKNGKKYEEKERSVNILKETAA